MILRLCPHVYLGLRKNISSYRSIIVNPKEENTWEVLCKPAKRVKRGTVISFGEGLLKAKCVAELDEGRRLLDFSYVGIFYEILDKLGEMPLPPYITEKLEDKERYQTVYSKVLVHLQHQPGSPLYQ